MLTIPPNGSDVKVFKERNRLEAARPRPTPTPALVPADNRPLFRAICLEPDCAWTWKSEEYPHEAIHTRTRARAHANAHRHKVRSVFDVIGQEDMTFRGDLVPRSTEVP